MSTKLNALLDRGPKGGDKANKALLKRHQRQLKEQLPRLDRMIHQARTVKEVRQFEAWRAQLINTLEKEGIKVPTATKTKDCVAQGEAHNWVLKGGGGTCRKCHATRTFGRKPFEVTVEHRNSVLAYVKSQKAGECGPWAKMAKAIRVSGSNLAVIVRAMLADGIITEPKDDGSLTYAIVPNKTEARAKAIARYNEQCEMGLHGHEKSAKAKGSPKVVNIKAKRAEKTSARRARSRKAA